MKIAYRGGPLDGATVTTSRPAAYCNSAGEPRSKGWGHWRTRKGVYTVGPEDGYYFDAQVSAYIAIGDLLHQRRQDAIANRKRHIEAHPEDREAYLREIRLIEDVDRQAQENAA